jgi:hypothetical protein
MSGIPDNERAKITAVLMRVVSELSGGHTDDDPQVATLMGEIIDVCYRSKIDGTDDEARSLLFESVDFIDQKDWLFVVKKISNSFWYEAKFGTDIETAKLEATVEWVTKAGVN